MIMANFCYLIFIISLVQKAHPSDAETKLSSLLKPAIKNNVKRSPLTYPSEIPHLRDRIDRSRCGRCMDDRYDYEERRPHRPYDRDDHDKRNDTDDRKYEDDRRYRDRYNNRPDDRYRQEDRYYDERYYRDRASYDPYKEKRPYDRYPYDRYDEMAGRYDNYGYRRVYDERYDRGNGYDDGYGSYSPNAGRGPHDRPWDETYRGHSGWDAAGRGYYFASGRPDYGDSGWGRNEYMRPISGWRNVDYREPDYRGSRYPEDDRPEIPYRPSGWHSVDRRPYRDQNNYQDTRSTYPSRDSTYPQSNRGQSTFNQNTPTSTTTTPENSYLYEREDHSTTKKDIDTSTKLPS